MSAREKEDMRGIDEKQRQRTKRFRCIRGRNHRNPLFAFSSNVKCRLELYLSATSKVCRDPIAPVGVNGTGDVIFIIAVTVE
jgi:hypothetical protein